MPNRLRAVSLIYGDGIGPEIMRATLRVLEAAGAELEPEEIHLQRSGERTRNGLAESAWESLRRTQVLLKAPVSSTLLGGHKNLNVTIRKTLGLYANIRPCVSYAPFVQTRHPNLDVVIIRENEEDLYGGIENRQTTDIVQSLKLISRPGCEKIIRYAFEYAQIHGRKKVSALTKDRIMEFTDGFFHQIFREIAAEYPELNCEHQSLDMGTARLADAPESFDVIVIPNLYGDILSDLATQISSGSIGLGGSTNFGDHCVMFEAIHGSAPTIAGHDLANPSGLLLSAVMMLVHMDQQDVAQRVHNAWLKTIEEGLHTQDIYSESLSSRELGTQAFADAVIERLGQMPQTLRPVSYSHTLHAQRNFILPYHRLPVHKELVGVDVFLDWPHRDVSALAKRLSELNRAALRLELMTNLGVQVWPQEFPETRLSDYWHCRFSSLNGPVLQAEQVLDLLQAIATAGFDFVKTENLYRINGALAYSG